MSQSIALTEAQVKKIREMTVGNTKNFGQAYDYIYEQIAGDPSVSPRLKLWFQNAGPINRNEYTTAANTFVRSVTKYGLEWDGLPTDNLQGVSDEIGRGVIGPIIDNGAIPQLDVILKTDILRAIEEGGQTYGGWGGAFYFWDAVVGDNGETIGELIYNDPVELEKFISINAAATVATAKSEFGQSLPFAEGEGEYWEILNSSFSAEVPANVKYKIVARAKEGLFYWDLCGRSEQDSSARV